MLRLDRFLTLSLFYPLIRSNFVAGSRGIPILMYHSISDDHEPGFHPYYQVSTSSRVFAEHMKYLSDNGYSVLTIQEAVGLLRTQNSGYGRVVVLTFDDGFEDFYIEAFPILKAHGYPCTVFLPSAYVDNQEWMFKGRRCLSWKQVRELHGQGVAFGSHTLTHPRLTSLSPNEIKTELEVSKKLIEAKLSKSVESFSYPYAFPEQDSSFTAFLESCLHKYDYRNGVSTIVGTATQKDNPFFLKRIPVNTHDDIRMFEAKLNGGYDWLHALQHAHKRVARTLSNKVFRAALVGDCV